MAGILFLAHRVPYPPDRGDKMRSYHLLKALADLAPLHLVTFADDAADMGHAESLRPLLASLHVEVRARSRPRAALAALASGRPISLAAFDSAGLRRVAGVALRQVDTVFAFSGQMAQFVPEGFAGRFVMDFVDVDSAKFAAYAAQAPGPLRLLHAREARLLGRYERAVAARAHASLFVSGAEANLFRAGGGRRARVLENGIDLAFYDPVRPHDAPVEGPLVLFTGQMDYRPNVEAVTSFAAASWPAVRARVPDARFAVVGRNPDPAVLRLGDIPGVIVTGAVPDVRPWLAAARVAVAPLRTARGVQNKVLEAMAMARAVVASPAAFEGIDATPGTELVVADRLGEADAVAALLADPARAERIGRAARARMAARYGWEAALAPLAELVGREGRRERVAA